MHQVEGAEHGRGGAVLAQEVAEAELVEPVQVGVAERVSGVDAPDDLLQGGLDGLVGGDVGVGEPRRPGADVDRLGHLPGDLTRLGDVRRYEGQPELGHEPEVGGVRVAHHLSAQLDASPVGQLDLLDPAADPLACLEHGHGGSAGGQVASSAETGEAGPDDDDVGAHFGVPATSWSPRAQRAHSRFRAVNHRSSTVCSGSHPICTREPGVQRSPVLIRGRFCSSTVSVTSGATSTRYWVVAPW